MPVIEVPELGGQVEFPDEMSMDDISSAIGSHLEDIYRTGVQTATQLPGQVLGMLLNPAVDEASELGQEQGQSERDSDADLRQRALSGMSSTGAAALTHAPTFTGSGSPMDPMLTIPRVEADDPAFQTAVTSILGRPVDDETLSSLAAGVNSASGFASGMTSPVNLAALGLGGMGGAVVKRLIALGFGLDIGRHIPAQATEAGTKSVTGTPQERKEAYLNLGISGALVPGLGLHGLRPSVPPGLEAGRILGRNIDETQIPPDLLEDIAMRGPGNAVRIPGQPLTPPYRAVVPENLGEQLRLMGPRPPIRPKPAPPNIPRGALQPEVPETAVEPTRFLTEREEELATKALQAKQARQAGARTKEQIREMFPEMNRQQAAEIRDLAWPKGETTDASQVPEATEVHGDLQPPPGEGTREVPAVEGGEGVQPQAQRVAQAPQVPLSAPPPPQPNMVRLYHGSGGTEGAGASGAFWTSDFMRARSFGPNMEYVDVSPEVADAAQQVASARSGTSSDHILPDAWVKRARPFGKAGPGKVYDLDQPVEPAAPAAPAELTWMSKPLSWWEKVIASPQFQKPTPERAQLAKQLGVPDAPKAIRDKIRAKLQERRASGKAEPPVESPEQTLARLQAETEAAKKTEAEPKPPPPPVEEQADIQASIEEPGEGDEGAAPAAPVPKTPPPPPAAPTANLPPAAEMGEKVTEGVRKAKAVADYWKTKQGSYTSTPQGMGPGGASGKAIGGTYKQINERKAAAKVRRFEQLAADAAQKGLSMEQLAEIDAAHKNLPKELRQPPKPAAADPEAVAKEIGFTFRPGRQIGSMSMEGLTAEEIAKLKAAGQPVLWDFTDPNSGITFYAPEGSTRQQILDAHRNKLAEMKATEERLAEFKRKNPLPGKPAESEANLVPPEGDERVTDEQVRRQTGWERKLETVIEKLPLKMQQEARRQMAEALTTPLPEAIGQEGPSDKARGIVARWEKRAELKAATGAKNITAKQLTEQKGNLLEQVNAALKTPPAGKQVVFDVPGDGTWTIQNHPDVLKNFKTKIEKEFPKNVPGSGAPSTKSGAASKPAPISTPDPGELGKIVSPFLSTDESRYVITSSYSDGTQIIATDGRTLLRVITQQAPGKPHAPLRLNAEGKPVEVEDNFPDWRRVIDHKDASLVYGGLDTKDMFHIAKQAQVLRNSGGDANASMALHLYVNPDRSIGGRLKLLDGDSYEHNLQAGSKYLGGYNPDYIIEAMQAARRLGNAKLDVYFHGSEEIGPISFVGQNHENIIMPLRDPNSPIKRAKPSEFSGVIGRPEHSKIGDGFGPIQDPEGSFTDYTDTAAGHKYRTTLAKGVLTIEEVKERAAYRGVPAETYTVEVGRIPILYWPRPPARQLEALGNLLKGYVDRTAPDVEAARVGTKYPQVPAAVKAIQKDVLSVIKQRNDAVKELQQRQKASGIEGETPLTFYSGIPIPSLAQLDQAIGEVRNFVSSHNFTTPIAKVSKKLRNAWNGFAMKQAPRITEFDRLSGELGVRYAHATIVARDKGLLFADKVLREAATLPEFDRKFGTALTEDNLRDIKAKYSQLADEAENRGEYIERAKEDIGNMQELADDGDPAARRTIAQLRRDITRWEGYSDDDARIFQEKADAVTSLVGQENSPFADEDQYQAFLSSPEAREAVGRHIRLWQHEKDPIYRQANDLDPDLPLETRGTQTGARINLKAVFGKEGTPTTVGSATRSTLIRQAATRLKKDVFGLPAKGTGASYEGSYREIMGNGYEREFPVAAQHEFINRLLDAGLAKTGPKEFPEGLEIKGEPTKAYELKLRPWVDKKQWIHIPKSIAFEYESLFPNLRPATRISYYTPVAELATRMSVQGLAEGSTHASNLLMEVFTGVGPTSHPLLNALLKVAGRADLLLKIPQVIIKAFGDRHEQMLKLAEMGAAKEAYRGRFLGALLTKVDQGVRLTADSTFKGLADAGLVENTETNRREFIGQVGNYNKRTQPQLIRWLRDTHVQPFATAMQTFNVMGIRRMALAPGVKASNLRAAAALRADIAAGWIGFGVVVGTLNYLLSGNASGPPGTKLGAIGWIGKDGHLHQFDAGMLTGYTRGARVTGLQGLIEAKRAGLSTENQIAAALQGPANVVVGGISGPLNRALTIGTTGMRPGFPMVQEAPVKPPQSQNDEYQWLKGQNAANMFTALRQANPGVDFALSSMTDKPWEEIMRRQFSRYMPRTGQTPETIAALPQITEMRDLRAYSDSLGKQARKIPARDRAKWTMDQLQKDQVAPEFKQRVLSELRRHGVFSHP